MNSSRPGSRQQQQRQRRSILTSAGGNGGNNAASKDAGGIQSVFRSPSLEDKLASLGIDLSSARGREEGGGDLGGGRRRLKKTSSDISKRISGIGQSMEEYDRKVRDVQETMQTAYRKTVQDRRGRLGGGDGGDSSGGSLDQEMDAETFLQKCRASLKKDLMRKDFGGDEETSEGSTSPRKYFGLDNEAVLGQSESEEETSSSEEDEETSSSESGSESSSEEEPTKMKISVRGPPPGAGGKLAKQQNLRRLEENVRSGLRKPPPPPQKGKGKVRITKEDLMPPRSLSPIMPEQTDKQFQNLLERREERASRQLNSMKNGMAQLQQKVELDKRKAKEVRTMPRGYGGKPLRKMKPEAGGQELNNFVQATGGTAGGWERKDHGLFMKVYDLWRKHPNKMMEELRKALPDKPLKELGQHVKWYEKFEQLASENRQTVYKWKQEKRRETELIYQMGSASQMAKMEGDKRRQERLKMIREQEKDRSKEKLAEWKRNREIGSRGDVASATSSVGRRPGSSTTGGGDEGESIRQHVLELTAKVHGLDHPKREFRPPRPLAYHQAQEKARVPRRELEEFGGNKLGNSRSFTSLLGSRPPTPPGQKKEVPRLKLPEIEVDQAQGSRTRPGSGSTIRPPSGSLLHQQHQRNRRLIQGFRERDSKLVEAKKKAVEIARERRKSNIGQLTPEEIKRRIRSRVGSDSGATPSFLNPTKQSELRKTLTHLERLEMLSKQDITALGGATAMDGGGLVGGPGDILGGGGMLLSNLPSKGTPSWRRPGSGAGGEYF